jgi:hypothetical protein
MYFLTGPMLAAAWGVVAVALAAVLVARRPAAGAAA